MCVVCVLSFVCSRSSLRSRLTQLLASGRLGSCGVGVSSNASECCLPAPWLASASVCASKVCVYCVLSRAVRVCVWVWVCVLQSQLWTVFQLWTSPGAALCSAAVHTRCQCLLLEESLYSVLRERVLGPGLYVCWLRDAGPTATVLDLLRALAAALCSRLVSLLQCINRGEASCVCE